MTFLSSLSLDIFGLGVGLRAGTWNMMWNLFDFGWMVVEIEGMYEYLLLQVHKIQKCTEPINDKLEEIWEEINNAHKKANNFLQNG